MYFALFFSLNLLFFSFQLKHQTNTLFCLLYINTYIYIYISHILYIHISFISSFTTHIECHKMDDYPLQYFTIYLIPKYFIFFNLIIILLRCFGHQVIFVLFIIIIRRKLCLYYSPFSFYVSLKLSLSIILLFHIHIIHIFIHYIQIKNQDIFICVIVYNTL